MVKRPRRAITLLEVLVLIAVAVILLGLLIPAIQSPRVAPRRTVCAHNLKNLALATIQYEGTERELPGYLHHFGTFPGGSDPSDPDPRALPVGSHAKIGTWAVTLLPHLGEERLYEHWSEDKYPLLSSGSSDGDMVDGVYSRRALPNLSIFICTSARLDDQQAAQNSYVANCGVTGTSPLPLAEAWRSENGPFNNKYRGPSMLGDTTPTGPSVRMEDFKDGTGNTLLFTENLQAQPWHRISLEPVRENWALSMVLLRPEEFLEPNLAKHYTGIVWHHYDDGGQHADAPPPQVLINGDKDAVVTPDNAAIYARPSSAHAGGVNVAFADGRTSFLSESIDYRTYQALLTLHGESSDVPYREFVPDAP